MVCNATQCQECVWKMFQEQARITNSPAKDILIRCTCYVCGNSFKIKFYIRKRLQKMHLVFFVSKFKFYHFRHLVQNTKPQKIKKINKRKAVVTALINFKIGGQPFKRRDSLPRHHISCHLPPCPAIRPGASAAARTLNKSQASMLWSM